MNLYNSLELDSNCSKSDIKNAYKKLIIKWHPDKNKIQNKEECEKKFREIKFAYEILYNEQTRKEYDFTLQNDDKPYELFLKILKKNKFCNKIINSDILVTIIEQLYGDHNKFLDNIKKNVNNYNFDEIFDLLIGKESELDIKFTIGIKLEDIYEIKYKNLSIKRFINNKLVLENLLVKIDPYTEELIYEGKGDIHESKSGDVIIKFTINDDSIDILDNFNLLIKTKYFNSIKLPNSYIINKEEGKVVFSCEKYKIYKFYNLGLLNECRNERGDLFIKSF